MFQRVVRLAIDPTNGQGQEFEGLRLEFSTRRTSQGLDAANLRVWGLGEDSYGQIQRSDTLVRLIAGHLDTGTGVLMQGTVVKDSLRRRVEAGEVITEWQVHEAGVSLASVRLSASWQGQVTAREVANYVADQLGVGRLQQELPTEARYARGYVVSGDARQVLRTLAADCGCTYAIQGGRLVFVPRAGTLRTRSLSFGPDSGLVGWPEAADGGKVVAEVMLAPSVLPGDLYRVEGELLAGDYVAEVVEHDGDSGWSNPYYTRSTGRRAS